MNIVQSKYLHECGESMHLFIPQLFVPLRVTEESALIKLIINIIGQNTEKTDQHLRVLRFVSFTISHSPRTLVPD